MLKREQARLTQEKEKEAITKMIREKEKHTVILDKLRKEGKIRSVSISRGVSIMTWTISLASQTPYSTHPPACKTTGLYLT